MAASGPSRMFDRICTKLDAVAYTEGTVVFVHVVHFKAQGGIVPNWCHGKPGQASQAERDQPLKRILALQTIQSGLIAPG